MGMFDFLAMADNYEERAVDRYEDEEIGLIIDTAAVDDSDKPYETAVSHPAYNKGKWIIVELYDILDTAQAGHDKWVAKMTKSELPKKLIDVSTAEIADLCDGVSGADWRIKAMQEVDIRKLLRGGER